LLDMAAFLTAREMATRGRRPSGLGYNDAATLYRGLKRWRRLSGEGG